MTRRGAIVYAAAILAGAVLVFQVQPIAGKFLLPAFGGGASVWTTCMFFFQTMLLLGYAYAHGLTVALPLRLQPVAHGALLLLSAAFLPLSFSLVAGDAAAGDPGGLIWIVLLASLGFPFVLLASTAPLVQRWASATRPARSPYRLYALSNAGALAALLSYPLWVEPALSLRGQTILWSSGYLLFLLASLAACVLVRHHPAAAADQAGTTASEALPPWRVTDALLTVLLSACGVVMLLAVTNQVTQNVAPIPFLWVLPLVAFLLTYIVTFSGERWYDRTIWGSLFVVAASCLILLEFFATSFPIVPVIAAYLLVLTCVCMVCHGELYRVRPAPARLSLYYLLLGFGGALGGAFVSVVAPEIFTRYWEGLAGAYLVYIALGIAVIRGERPGRIRPDPRTLTPLEARLLRWARPLFITGWSAGLVLFPAVIVLLGLLASRNDIASVRNFYGLLNVRDVTADEPARRVLVDGTTIHGFQLLDAARMQTPTSYYARSTGIGRLLDARRADDLDIGVVGLGVGTLAAYGTAGDRLRFYELNPAVQDLAGRYFTFLEASQADVEVIIGDGRISLARELRQDGSRAFDVLVVDAFSSDAIPVHLLTLEAQQLYWSHIAEGGVLAFHVTNNYLDLAPVIAGVAEALGKQATLTTNAAASGIGSMADWVVVTDAGDGPDLRAGDGLQVSALRPPAAGRTWTDDYSNLLQTLR